MASHFEVCHPDPSPRVFTSTPPPLYHLHTSIPTQEEVESRLEVKELVVPEQEVGAG